ncbi:50S ribosomal protein L28 [Nocardia arthritidis]|nr:50S ribosomal protein L28 [Nocardia arthritidis]
MATPWFTLVGVSRQAHHDIVPGHAAPRMRRSPHDMKEFATMAAVCDVCAKGPGFGKSVSHSHRRTNRRWNPNIQTVRAQVAPGNTRRMNVCTSCLKAGKVVRG